MEGGGRLLHLSFFSMEFYTGILCLPSKRQTVEGLVQFETKIKLLASHGFFNVLFNPSRYSCVLNVLLINVIVMVTVLVPSIIYID